MTHIFIDGLYIQSFYQNRSCYSKHQNNWFDQNAIYYSGLITSQSSMMRTLGETDS